MKAREHCASCSCVVVCVCVCVSVCAGTCTPNLGASTAAIPGICSRSGQAPGRGSCLSPAPPAPCPDPPARKQSPGLLQGGGRGRGQPWGLPGQGTRGQSTGNEDSDGALRRGGGSIWRTRTRPGGRPGAGDPRRPRLPLGIQDTAPGDGGQGHRLLLPHRAAAGMRAWESGAPPAPLHPQRSQARWSPRCPCTPRAPRTRCHCAP